MNISLPDSLKAFVENEVTRVGDSTSRAGPRPPAALVLEGGASPEDATVNEAYFQSLHARIDAYRPE